MNNKENNSSNNKIKEEMSLLLKSYNELKENWINYLIPLNEIEFVYEENEELNKEYEWMFLRRFLAKHKWITVWRILYYIDFEKLESHLLMIDTLNDCKQFIEIFENDELTSNNIIEKWLWTLMVKNYIKELKDFWILNFHFQSLITSVWFYNKLLWRLIEEWEILSYDNPDGMLYEVYL